MSGTRSTRSSANSSSSSSEDDPPPPPPPTRVVVSPIKGNSPNPRVVMEKVKEECLIEKKVDKVDKVSVAIKHPGVFMETAELEKETGQKLKVGISQEEKKEKKDSEPEKEEEKTEKDGETTKMYEEPSEEQMEQVDDSQKKEEAAPEENISTGTPEPKPAEDKDEDEATLDGNPVKMEIEEAEIEISQPASKVLTRRSRRTGAATAVDEDVKKEEDQGVSSESSSGVRLPLELPTGEDSEGEDVSCANSGPTVAKEDNDSVGSSSTQTTTRSSTRRRAGGDESAADSVLSSSASLSRRAKTGLKGGHVGANPKGPKGRRSIFKKSPCKAPTAVARAITSDRIYFRGEYFTRGDIVSITDMDGGVYYAQFRGFLTDQYCEKSAVISWLLPTQNSPKPEDGFDPATYIIGPEEELPRKMEYFSFVMHAPDDYFLYKNAPYPTKAIKTDQEYLLTRLGPKIRIAKDDGKSLYQDLYE